VKAHIQQRRRTNDAVKIGDAVEAVFDAMTLELTIPRFKLHAA
jgi:hypothetical protein